MKRFEIIKNSKIVVVKVGTSTITHSDGKLDIPQMDNLVSQICFLKDKGIKIVLVTSGAISAGMAEMGLKKRPKGISELQACAAVGQGRLIETYAQFFKKKGYTTAQILLTADDLRNRARYLNARNTMIKLLDEGVIPVVNENDTVAIDEIKFGDNDKLSALVTNLVQADLLIILSDVDGLYDINGKVIEKVQHIGKDIEELCKGKGSALGTGGMKTKLEAAKIVTRSGQGMIITDGRKNDVLIELFKGTVLGTFFEPHAKGLSSKKRWITFFAKTHGSIIVDIGAEGALINKGRSLLSSGITEIKGTFKAGDAVNIVGPEGRRIACGLVNYSSEELNMIRGLRTSEIMKVLGYKTNDEVVHRNNMTIL